MTDHVPDDCERCRKNRIAVLRHEKLVKYHELKLKALGRSR